MHKKQKVYVGCSLTYASKEFIKQVEDFKEDMRSFCEVLDFMGIEKKPGRTPENIYTYDVEYCVGNADLMVAICDHPSLGLGYEIATQIEKHSKPILALAHKDALVSELILGINKPYFEFKRYENMTDMIPHVKEALKNKARNEIPQENFTLQESQVETV